jgi:hypothetical protein
VARTAPRTYDDRMSWGRNRRARRALVADAVLWSRSVDVGEAEELEVDLHDEAGLVTLRTSPAAEVGSAGQPRIVVVEAATGDEVAATRQARRWWVDCFGDGQILLLDDDADELRHISG